MWSGPRGPFDDMARLLDGLPKLFALAVLFGAAFGGSLVMFLRLARLI